MRPCTVYVSYPIQDTLLTAYHKLFFNANQQSTAEMHVSLLLHNNTYMCWQYGTLIEQSAQISAKIAFSISDMQFNTLFHMLSNRWPDHFIGPVTAFNFCLKILN